VAPTRVLQDSVRFEAFEEATDRQPAERASARSVRDGGR
jgi:hypothetical protein